MDQTTEIGLPLFVILWGILGMLLLAIAIITFFLIYQRRLFAQQKNIQRLEAEYQKKLLQYSFETQEAERKRIASDLHDEIGSILSAIRIYVHQLDPQIPTDNFKELKTDTTGMIDNAIERIRGISHNLFPPNLEHLGLLQASIDFCNGLKKVNNMVVQFDYQKLPALTKQQELALYRILQELASNTLKHATANEIQLRFAYANHQFRMTYQDNGKGFSHRDQQEHSEGLGLKSIESRANSIGAKIQFQTPADSGCHCDVVFNHEI